MMTSDVATIEDQVEQALTLHEQGKSAEAEALCRRILAAAPGTLIALHLSAVIALNDGRAQEAETLLTRAIAIDSGDPQAYNYRGTALLNLGRFQEALACYTTALTIDPRFAEAYNNRGAVFAHLEQFDEAIESYDAALAIAPDYIEAHYNRGTALLRIQRFTLALASLDKVAATFPQMPEVHYSRGLALLSLGRFDDAIAAYDRALVLKPDFPEALRGRADALGWMNRPQDIVDSYDRLAGSASQKTGSYAEAICEKFHAQLQCCDWKGYETGLQFVRDTIERGTYAKRPYHFLFQSSSPAMELRCARNYVAHHYAEPSRPLWRGERYGHDKIRIAYLSSDYREHPTSYLAAGLFERHDRDRFETYGISFWPYVDCGMRKRVEPAFDRFIDVVDRSDYDVALLLRDLEIDIAVHLNGHTDPGRLPIMTHRPAPVHVNFLGYPGTMGADFIDYIIADRHVLPPGEEKFYAEKVVRLPDTYQVNDNRRAIGPPPRRADVGLPDKAFVFCCFNKNLKITPAMFDIWMRILHRVEGSVLWLAATNETSVQNLKRETAARGIAPERVVYAPFTHLTEHLARHTLADLALDTLPYSSHTIASDALWAGVPLVTCKGPTFAGRVSTSLLHAVGLPELVTDSLADYEQLVFDLATNPDRLTALRIKLSHNRLAAPLFDTDRFRRHIEAAYLTMWQRAERGEAPASFDVMAQD